MFKFLLFFVPIIPWSKKTLKTFEILSKNGYSLGPCDLNGAQPLANKHETKFYLSWQSCLFSSIAT
jgi:hypothetical protein